MALSKPDPESSADSRRWPIRELGRDIPLTKSARDILALGQRLAAGGGSPQVMREHLLLALTRVKRTPAAAALIGLGLHPDEIARTVEAQLPAHPATPS